ncbi:MAG: HAD-IB family hydrolase [Haliea sp.]|nr:HAD-IB family hydrolase [Haliea sp.]
MTTLDTHLQSITASRTDQATIAFFDLDRTLIAGYSILAIARETAEQGARRGKLREATKVVQDILKHKVYRSGANYHRLVKRTTKALSGVSESTLRDIGENAYRKYLAKSLYREAVALVEAHRAAGHKLAIVSSASRYQIEPIARVLGIEEIHCTQLEVVEGRFTGQVIVPMCYGEGKLLAAQRSARQHKAALKNCWFYSDSSADLPLVRKVGHPVAVNPSDKLGAHARTHKWQQLFFSTRGMPSAESIVRTLLTAQTIVATTAVGMLAKQLGRPAYRSANHLTRMFGDIGSAFAGLDFEIEGLENLGRERPAIFVFNHQSLRQSAAPDRYDFCRSQGIRPTGSPAEGAGCTEKRTFTGHCARRQSQHAGRHPAVQARRFPAGAQGRCANRPDHTAQREGRAAQRRLADTPGDHSGNRAAADTRRIDTQCAYRLRRTGKSIYASTGQVAASGASLRGQRSGLTAMALGQNSSDCCVTCLSKNVSHSLRLATGRSSTKSALSPADGVPW